MTTKTLKTIISRNVSRRAARALATLAIPLTLAATPACQEYDVKGFDPCDPESAYYDPTDPDCPQDTGGGGPTTDTSTGIPDTDGDGVPDDEDTDDDDDGLPDGDDEDDDGDGVPDVDDPNTDTDWDGTPDDDDLDDDDDGIPDDTEGTVDTDGDGLPDDKDTDSDDDGIPDQDETDEGTVIDSDDDGTPDYVDTDSDDDGDPDEDEGTDDTDGDGVPDYTDPVDDYTDDDGSVIVTVDDTYDVDCPVVWDHLYANHYDYSDSERWLANATDLDSLTTALVTIPNDSTRDNSVEPFMDLPVSIAFFRVRVRNGFEPGEVQMDLANYNSGSWGGVVSTFPSEGDWMTYATVTGDFLVVNSIYARFSSYPAPGADTEVVGVYEIEAQKADCDEDGYESEEWGGTDCDDTDNDVHPGATDGPGGDDSNCDGTASLWSRPAWTPTLLGQSESLPA